MRLVFFLLLALAPPAVRAADDAISFLEKRVQADPDDFTAQNQLASRYLDLARNTGDDDYLLRARHAAEASVKVGVPDLNTGGFALLGRVQLGFHEFAAAQATAEKLRGLGARKTLWLGILGDALLELGQYPEAGRVYGELDQATPGSLESETRLARFAIIEGQLDAAKSHFETALAAAKDLTPRAPDLEAWCNVQTGQLEFARGNWAAAEKQYEAALNAVPQLWSALEHMAEVRAAQQKYPEATSLYEKVIGKVPRPELAQALGDLYLFMNKPTEAKPWHERAEAGYLKMAQQGDARYWHHLAGFYSDSVENPEEALKWAKKDLGERHSVFAHDALAWSFYRAGKFIEAAAETKLALAQGTQDAHLLFHAGMIATANGDPAGGKKFLEQAARVNPHYNAFHVHR